MTPITAQGTFSLTCGHVNERDSSFGVPYGDIVHLSPSGERIVHFAMCPHGERIDIDDGDVPRVPEVLAAISVLNRQKETYRALRDMSSFERFLRGIGPINW